MAVFKCKMCGGDLNIIEGATVVECEYCGTRQTLPKLGDDRKANLYDRANHFRRNNEFDKAISIYEQILNEDTTDAESYWSLVLCRYGIEYVEDPTSKKRIPTVNRAQFTSIFDDEDYKSALKYADISQKDIYEQEAAAINEIQRGILEISQKEEPFDVFICYKETDNNGRRTPDSVLATELYHELTREGFKVFFSRITLEDKLGTAYEPYIFAALNSAKVMVVLGTRPEYFNAVWVKNEWSRYLALIKNGARKMLIPAYRDMDPYDLPEEFSHLQAQDMTKLGFMQDLIRGISKIVGANEPKQTVVKETVISNAPNIAPILKRAFIFLEDGDFTSADEYFEKVLDNDPEYAEAYLGKLLVELKVKKREDLKNLDNPFSNSNNYKKIIHFADDNLKTELKEYNDFIVNRRLNNLYNAALTKMYTASTKEEYQIAAQDFKLLGNFKDSANLADECIKNAEIAHKDSIYNSALALIKNDTIVGYNNAIKKLESIIDWRDSKEKIEFCNKKCEELKLKKEQEDILKKKQIKKSTTIILGSVSVLLVVIFVFTSFNFKPMKDITEISASDTHTVSLKKDGTVVSVGGNSCGQRDVGDWSDIISISAGAQHTVGLKSDGTVVAVGENSDGKCDVENWSDIIAISAGIYDHTVGLKSDGTVVAVGKNENGECAVGGWNDIIAIATGCKHTVGLMKDGTVISVGDNMYNQLNNYWGDITAISAGFYHTVGLKSEGYVLATGNNDDGQCDVSDWSDIIAISAGSSHTVGLKKDGTVVATGYNKYGQCNVSDWTDIVAISAGYFHTVGLKSDGTVVATGYNTDGQCDTGIWKGFFGIN